MKYLNKKFSVASPGSKSYRDNWERTFGKKPDPSNKGKKENESPKEKSCTDENE